MACFLVPAAEAIIVTAVAYSIKKKEQKLEAPKLAETNTDAAQQPAKLSWSRKLSWLSGLLWGGILLLAFEHLWHGEVVPWPPFLTAMGSAADTADMLHEMATVGVAMAAAVTAVWGGMVAIADAKFRKLHAAPVEEG